jgi:hypothetical protein
MAMRNSNKQPASSGGGGGGARINLVVLQMDGDTPAITKALESFVAAVQRPAIQVSGVATPRPPAVLAAAPASPQVPLDAVPTDDVGAPAAAEAAQESEAEDAPLSQPKPRKPPVFKPAKVLDELNAAEFEDYVAGRSVVSDLLRGVTAGMFLQEKRGLTEFGVDHINTCFVMMKWPMPDEPGSLLRNMKKARLVKSVEGKRGMYALSTVGIKKYNDEAK